MKIRVLFQVIALLLVTASLNAQSGAARVTTGFANPESALWDAQAKAWYVSNVGTGPLSKDGKGFISKLGADGAVTTLHWITGLNSPKGMGLVNDRLYIADIDEVVVANVKGGTVSARHGIDGSKFLNDVATSPAGDVYVSDMFTNSIYILPKGGAPQLLLQSAALENPNGLLVDGPDLIVAAWGHITDPASFGTKVPGRLLRVNLATKAVQPITSKPLGNLDGLVKAGDAYIVSDWVAGKVHRVTPSGESSLVRDGFKNSADFGYDPARRWLAVPEMGAGQVSFIELRD